MSADASVFKQLFPVSTKITFNKPTILLKYFRFTIFYKIERYEVPISIEKYCIAIKNYENRTNHAIFVKNCSNPTSK